MARKPADTPSGAIGRTVDPAAPYGRGSTDPSAYVGRGRDLTALYLLDSTPSYRKASPVMTKALVKLQQKFADLRSEKGATAVEYGLMVALIAVVIIVAVALLGKNLSTLFNTVSNSV